MGHKMGDKGTQHLTLGLEGTRWDTTGHNGKTGHNWTQWDRIGGDTLGYSTLGHGGTRRDAKSGTPNLGHKIRNTNLELKIYFVLHASKCDRGLYGGYSAIACYTWKTKSDWV